MIRDRILLIIFCALVFVCKTIALPTQDTSAQNSLVFEVSPHGLIFTKLIVQGEEVKAMIDFGDPHVLQLSSTLVEKLKIPVHSTGAKARFITGEEFDINEGTVAQVKIGQTIEKDVEFGSSPNEMESVSQQIGTEFSAVLGWGYFKKFYTILDYSQQRFDLYKEAKIPTNSVIRTDFLKHTSHLEISVSFGQTQTKAIIDTGSPVSVIDKLLVKELGNTEVMMDIGDASISHQFFEEDLSILADLNVGVILGGDILSQYQVHIDPIATQIMFVK